MMKRMKRSWIVDALFALAYALVEGLQSMLKLGDGRAVADSGDESFGSGLWGEYYWGPKWLFYCVWRFGSGGSAGAESLILLFPYQPNGTPLSIVVNGTQLSIVTESVP